MSDKNRLDESRPIERGDCAGYALELNEYDILKKKLGRTPNEFEVKLAASLWSEHCSYKSSKPFLKRFPTTGKDVIYGPGENAGVVSISDKYAVAFKMESHNHPSFIEPYQGAATGVGGILRDIFTMGARPVLSLDALWFGNPSNKKTAYLVDGVVRGIGDYGNCMGIPTLGGKTRFADCYNGNNLVNAFSLGIVKKDEIFTGAAPAGDSVIYVGSKTGRDGLGGAAMASAVFDESTEAKRPTVQVGDPFSEKLLLEACLELFKTGAVSGMQDMGAAGLASSSFEMAGRSNTGMVLDLDKVPLRQPLSASEIMLSESQERMLVIAKKGQEKVVFDIFKKWQLDAVKIGEVIPEPVMIIKKSGKTFKVPTKIFSEDAPVYRKKIAKPNHKDFSVEIDRKINTKEVILKLISDPNIADKSWITQQYDQSIRTDTLEIGYGAALIRLKDDDVAIAATVVGKPNIVAADPRYGAQRTVLEAACNLAVTGSTPLAITDCLNFGSPDKPEILYSFSESIEGISIAAEKLNTPVVSGNVSFYNETDGKPIWATPVIGMVGTRRPAGKPNFMIEEDDILFLIGKPEQSLACSAYSWLIKDDLFYDFPVKPKIEWSESTKIIKAVSDMVKNNKLRYIADISLGGVAVAIIKTAIRFNLGFRLDLPFRFSAPQYLFSEPPVQFIAVADIQALKEFDKQNIEYHKIGKFSGNRVVINNLDISIDKIRKIYEESFSKALKL